MYCSVLSLGGNVNTRRMSQSDMGSIFHWNILVIGNHYVNYQSFQNSMLLSFSDIKRTLMHLFLFRNSAQKELISICTQSIRNWNNFPCISTLLHSISYIRSKLDSRISFHVDQCWSKFIFLKLFWNLSFFTFCVKIL